jgi:hypothetical protein
MVNRLNAFLVSALIAAVVAIVALAYRVTLHSHAPEAVAAAASHDDWKHKAEERLVLYTLWLAIFTAVLAGSTIGLWIVTWRAARSAEKSVHFVEGAWIFAGPQHDGGTAFRLKMRNYGKTPSLVTRYHIEFARHAPSDEQPRYGVVAEKAVIVMGAGDFYAPPDRFTAGDADRFAIGFVDYTDVFGNQKTSRFCIELSTGGHAGSLAYNTFDQKRPD